MLDITCSHQQQTGIKSNIRAYHRFLANGTKHGLQERQKAQQVQQGRAHLKSREEEEQEEQEYNEYTNSTN